MPPTYKTVDDGLRLIGRETARYYGYSSLWPPGDRLGDLIHAAIVDIVKGAEPGWIPIRLTATRDVPKASSGQARGNRWHVSVIFARDDKDSQTPGAGPQAEENERE